MTHSGPRERFAALGCGVLGIALVSMFAQNPRTGQISGTVSRPNGSPVTNAQVVLRSSLSEAHEKHTETDAAGHYSFPALALGPYKVSAGASGFQTSEAKVVIVTPVDATANITLVPSDAVGENSAVVHPPPSPPKFNAAGARGSIAPSGYSSGLSSLETANVRARVNALQPGVPFLFGEPTLDCTEEPALIREFKKAPDSFEANHKLGVFYLNHGNYSKAIEYLEAARSIAPRDVPNSRYLALAMVATGRAPDAVLLLEHLLPDHDSDASLWTVLAIAYTGARENEKAVAALQKASAHDLTVENQYECGMEMLRLSALPQALDLFAVATKSHPESARLWFGLGLVQHLLDRKDEAVLALLHSANADADFLPPLTVLAEFSSLSDQTEVDLRRRTAAYLVAHPRDAEAHLTYALVLSKQSQMASAGSFYEEIASELKRTLQLNPRIARAHFLLGDAETDSNRLPAAIEEFEAGIKLEPDNARAHYRLALLYRRSGQPNAARKEMDAFNALREKEADAAQPQSKIEFSFSTAPVAALADQRCDSNSQ